MLGHSRTLPYLFNIRTYNHLTHFTTPNHFIHRDGGQFGGRGACVPSRPRGAPPADEGGEDNEDLRVVIGGGAGSPLKSLAIMEGLRRSLVKDEAVAEGLKPFQIILPAYLDFSKVFCDDLCLTSLRECLGRASYTLGGHDLALALHVGEAARPTRLCLIAISCIGIADLGFRLRLVRAWHVLCSYGHLVLTKQAPDHNLRNFVERFSETAIKSAMGTPPRPLPGRRPLEGGRLINLAIHSAFNLQPKRLILALLYIAIFRTDYRGPIPWENHTTDGFLDLLLEGMRDCSRSVVQVHREVLGRLKREGKDVASWTSCLFRHIEERAFRASDEDPNRPAEPPIFKITTEDLNDVTGAVDSVKSAGIWVFLPVSMHARMAKTAKKDRKGPSNLQGAE
ncbi:uncharacterized protein GGS22DRAFT_197210 [Annulohypoxylon maeteangense]|uniref:uncharacterized protein n=1 Tax=Annulohypoxylon maeteangense TaxID=1927788 RepID=UPI002008EB2F|nr:uncharacterized protein GGS22DRAFT_197210 [Annulohypoxylon maeteangense]KAI0880841.1 hypothetical protein GGS22DRAFT_197210 [Annulohypoxylon maeteangense]